MQTPQLNCIVLVMQSEIGGQHHLNLLRLVQRIAIILEWAFLTDCVVKLGNGGRCLIHRSPHELAQLPRPNIRVYCHYRCPFPSEESRTRTNTRSRTASLRSFGPRRHHRCIFQHLVLFTVWLRSFRVCEYLRPAAAGSCDTRVHGSATRGTKLADDSG